MNSRTPSTTPSFADVANRYRRQTLSILAEEKPLTISELASRIAARSPNGASGESTDAQVRSAQIALYHVHLPKLADSGLVSYAHESGEVTVPANVGDLSKIADTYRSQLG
ncbi:helix-turn-helix transcriptional regulator [Halostagnicola sp. A56]|uniref:DUF7344 domain-containing protein n=1 Tax=Halostagnicola sp. A56 TaxID=1495067 RepID=UPI00049EBA76|nr:helix-turn-helix transcriptional regulator [Halostagnicola sp. A56]